MDRRRFLRSLSFSTAALLSGAFPVRSRSGSTERPAHRVFADLHNHAMMDEWAQGTPIARKFPLMSRAILATANPTGIEWEKSHEVGIDVVCVAHYNVFDELASMPTDPLPQARVNTLRMIDQLEEELAGPAAPYARIARDRGELAELLAVPKSSDDFRVAVVHALEGGHALGGEIEALEEFARRGVAYVTITHFLDNGLSSAANALPFFPDAGYPSPARGLSGLGRDVIREMERLGVLVDVPHMTTTAMAETLAIAKRPLLASHVGSRTLCDRPYTLPDEHVVEIARRGGLIGVVLFPYHLSNYGTIADAREHGSVDDVVRTVRHFAKICGTHRHVGIGSDFGGFITPAKGLARDTSISRLREALLAEFEDETIVEDVLANNAIDFLGEHWRSGPA